MFARRNVAALGVAVALAAITAPAWSSAVAATLMVGPGQRYAAPSDAARAANSGDVVRIAPGTYYDCALWTTNNLTIEGTGPGVVLTDRVCQGKAIFLVQADQVTIRNITFARARAADGNGAGIRAEGANLTIENSKFINNEDGILADDSPKSTIVIGGSEFDRNGACGNGCAHGVYVGRIALLRILHSRFFETMSGHHIRSGAARTEIIGSRIMDGARGTASYLVDIPNGGSLVMVGNVLEKGPKNQNSGAAIIIGEEGADQPKGELVIRNNVFTNDGPSTVFVRNLTAADAQLAGNTLNGNATVPIRNDRFSIMAAVHVLRHAIQSIPGKRYVALALAILAVFIVATTRIMYSTR